MEPLIVLQWILAVASTLVLATVLGFTLLNLGVFRRPAEEARRGRLAVSDKELPRLSVLVPARNEERVVGSCLASLVEQVYPDYEVILLDDGSSDATQAIARGLGFGDSGRLRVISGKPLPPGWTGKGWACHQLYGEAQGDWLLFTDADTTHAPDGLRTALAFAMREKASLCSCWPQQITVSFAEKLVIPLVFLLILGFLPQFVLAWIERIPALARRLPRSWVRALGAANGQFLLVRRDAYEAIGGHKSVRNHLVEDVALGRSVAARLSDGLRLVNCDGTGVVSCRMYWSAAEVWEGFTKNLRQAFEGNSLAFAFSIVVQAVGFVLPFVTVWLGGWWTILSLSQIAVIYLIRGILTVRFGTSWVSALLHPIGHLFALAIALDSARRWATGQVRWKGRHYTRESLGE